MDKDLDKIVEIPEGVTVTIEGNKFTVKKDGKEVARKFKMVRTDAKVEGKGVKIHVRRATRREAKMLGTIVAHLKNMIKGVQEDYEYKLEIANVHFPMNVKVDGDKITIKSFLGETVERIAKIHKDAKVDIQGNQIAVTSFNIEAAGQTAANIEKATKLTGRDRRIFQDGIFITEKPSGKI